MRLILLALLVGGALAITWFIVQVQAEIQRRERVRRPPVELTSAKAAHHYRSRQALVRDVEKLRSNDFVWPVVPEEVKQSIEKHLNDFYNE